jgi:hypothetical protein
MHGAACGFNQQETAPQPETFAGTWAQRLTARLARWQLAALKHKASLLPAPAE